MLYELIYASKASSSLNVIEVKKMIDHAAVKNARFHLSGVLLFGQDHFLQVIEGDREILNSLFRKIYIDKRHEKISILSMASLKKRHFEAWSMGLIAWQDNMRPAVSQILTHHTHSIEFKPHQYQASQAQAICKSMVASENRLPIHHKVA